MRVVVFISVWLTGVLLMILILHNILAPWKYILIGSSLGIIYAVVGDYFFYRCKIENTKDIEDPPIDNTNEVD